MPTQKVAHTGERGGKERDEGKEGEREGRDS